jgi:heme oxygenase (biliverdin-IX-beta and delta-forming)
MPVTALASKRAGANSAATSPLREKLKQATAPAHRDIDAQFSRFDLTSVAGYRRFLEASAAALVPLEAALEVAGIASVIDDWPQRSRRAAIVSDLARLNGAVRPLGEFAPLNRSTALGVMYVLEGSRLGAKVLLRTIAVRSEPEIAAATRYLRHGAGQALWPSFLLTLEREPQNAEAEIIAGAQRAFAVFAKAAARA